MKRVTTSTPTWTLPQRGLYPNGQLAMHPGQVASFVKYPSVVTCVHLGQRGVPQCIASRPATAAAAVGSRYFEVRMSKCELQKFTSLCPHAEFKVSSVFEGSLKTPLGLGSLISVSLRDDCGLMALRRSLLRYKLLLVLNLSPLPRVSWSVGLMIRRSKCDCKVTVQPRNKSEVVIKQFET